ncbi:calcium-dependent mitochondrial ATP-magnesium/phosphate carrier protein 2-like [Aristolochia californica]|uniref:calcium-dependent mitochondrial ATP-magnesium/phosphate carrier protein 2-like n=1 Tax=Aristolochia californica TaxID=171875 RepID=UPI0035DF5034
MVSGHDPVESLQTTLHAFETTLRRTVGELCRAGLTNSGSEHEDLSFPQFIPSGPLNKKSCHDVVLGVDRKSVPSSSFIRVPLKAFFGTIFNGRRMDTSKKGLKERNVVQQDTSCSNCLHFAVSWSLLLNGFVQAFPSPIKHVKKCFQRQCFHEKPHSDSSPSPPAKPRNGTSVKNLKQGEFLQLELLLGFVFDQITQNLQKFDHANDRSSCDTTDSSTLSPSPSPHFDHFRLISGFLKGRKADVNGFLTNLKFARVGGVPSSLMGVDSSEKEEGVSHVPAESREEPDNTPGYTQRLASGLLNIPLSNVERLKSTLSTVSLTELIELVPQLGRSSKDYPDKKKLFSVQDFFTYAEGEGKRFFEELDSDGDGQVTLEDLEIAMAKRRLPRRYARDLLRRTRSHFFSKSIGWKQFLTLMEQREPTILRAYTTLCLSKSGTLQKNQILTSLKSAGLPASEENVVAMMRCLDADADGSISYGHFRNFMLLLPSERLKDDPRNIWFEAATVVAVAPPVEIPAENVLKSALAGGLACALSTSLLYPVDTMKTRVQASTLSFPELVSKLPQIGVQGLYRGSIPAILGQFSSHGLRTGIFEVSKLVLVNVAPTLPDIQVQTLASFCSTILGTAVRIPCEVLKQRLQAGIFDNVGEAIVGTIRVDGFKGFFRGTGATLCREVPFYVAGMCLYEESKKAAQHLLSRDLEPWETIAVGAVSGGLAAVVTTPFDVMKTRMMTAPQGLPVSMSMVAFSILHQEGPLGLFKGAVPRFFWIAPLGAMNFAGYELAKKAMNKSDSTNGDVAQKRLANSG